MAAEAERRAARKAEERLTAAEAAWKAEADSRKGTRRLVKLFGMQAAICLLPQLDACQARFVTMPRVCRLPPQGVFVGWVHSPPVLFCRRRGKHQPFRWLGVMARVVQAAKHVIYVSDRAAARQ